ncbi:hypothetical protein AYI70_g2697, partial [Smittium culicis]
ETDSVSNAKNVTEAVTDNVNGAEPSEEYPNKFDRFSSKKNKEMDRLLSSKEACNKSIKNKDGKHDPSCDYYNDYTGEYTNLRLSSPTSYRANSTSDDIVIEDSDGKENSPGEIDSVDDQLDSGEDDGTSLSAIESPGESSDEAGGEKSNGDLSDAPETPDNQEINPKDEAYSNESPQMIPVSGQVGGQENASEHPEIDEFESVFEEIDPEFSQETEVDQENNDSANQDKEEHENSSKESSDTPSDELVDGAAVILKKRRVRNHKNSPMNDSSDLDEHELDGSLTEEASPEDVLIEDSPTEGDSSPGEASNVNSNEDSNDDANAQDNSTAYENSGESSRNGHHNHRNHDSVPESVDENTGDAIQEETDDVSIDTMELYGCEGVDCIPVLFKKIKSIEKKLEKNSDSD